MSEISDAVKGKSKKATIWGILTVILGILAMAAPFQTALAVTIMIGAIMVVSGVSQTIFAFQAGSVGKGVLRFLFGGITLLAGLYVLGQPGVGLATLALVLAAYFIVDGIFTIGAGFGVSENRGWFIFNGVLSLILGIMMWRGWPVTGALAIGILVGIRLFFSGVMMLAVGTAGRQIGNAIEDRTEI